jgi:hypothetical protein
MAEAAPASVIACRDCRRAVPRVIMGRDDLACGRVGFACCFERDAVVEAWRKTEKCGPAARFFVERPA